MTAPPPRRAPGQHGPSGHGGTPAQPGRTATLIPKPGAKCFGTCFILDGLPAPTIDTILHQLEIREKQYDQRAFLDVYHPDGSLAFPRALTYIATCSPANQNWLGPAPLDEVAHTIAHARGPSGPNVDYLLRLMEELRRRGLGPAEDPYCFELEARVLKLRDQKPPSPRGWYEGDGDLRLG